MAGIRTAALPCSLKKSRAESDPLLLIFSAFPVEFGHFCRQNKAVSLSRRAHQAQKQCCPLLGAGNEWREKKLRRGWQNTATHREGVPLPARLKKSPRSGKTELRLRMSPCVNIKGVPCGGCHQH
ncbi:hypothetical protein SRHO_G00139320 [Serrasalmus rhombeus]